ncbi:putative aldouronate transport system permease protein [Kribbella amoyensis]|uniref:Putative aldouronate transport system permease protein n=1 Tax=Kribbella amoyensis TaxID=996641 RepID=A0A561BXD7_9ACTN|nr:carbohydrate ABC transporter permease [Kribbella amoyensis]TWD83527.1 putative aldouronate transport system permease protein [Kribbella amoyensis]
MSRPVWQEKPRPITLAGKGIGLVVTVLLIVLPFWVVIATSLSPDAQVIRNGGWSIWPERLSLDAYRFIFASGVVGHAMAISALVTVIGALASLAATVLLAYALARPGVFGGKPIMLGILVTFLFPAQMIPSFLVVDALGLRNNYAALIAPVLISTFNLVIMRGSFQGLPAELYESARLDGAGDWRVLWNVTLPLSKAVIAVVGFYYAVGYWNRFFNAMLYLDDQNSWPLQPLLRQIVLLGANPDTSMAAGAAELAPQTTTMATVAVAVFPILVAFPLVQRFFAKGVLTGAIKS